MSNVIQLPNSEQIFAQASDWIAKIDRELTAEEVAEFHAWLTQSEQHQKVFTEMAQLWDKMDVLERLSNLFPADEMVTNKRKVANKWYLAAAASIFMVMSSFLLLIQDNSLWGDDFITYETAVGESSTITLADNSTVLLNTDSVLKVTYTDAYRLLQLERGELHVDVAHDTKRPLSVVANGKVFQAVGTAFNVQVKRGDVELIVTDGKVVIAEVTDEKSDVEDALKIDQVSAPLVTKGEMVSLKVKDTLAKINVQALAEPQLTANLSWRQGNIIFNGESLLEAMQEVSRYTSTKFQIADKSIEDIKIAGRFKIGDVNGLVAALSNNFNIKADRVNKNLVVLTKQG